MLLTNIDDLRMDASDFADAVKDYEPSTLEYLGAKLGSGFDYTTTSSVLLEGRVQVAQYGQDLPGLNMDEIKASPYFRPEIKYEDGWTAERLRIYAEDYDQRAYEKWIISQHDTGFISGIAGFGAMLMGNLPDPLNAVPFGRGLSLAGKGLGAAAKRGVIEGVLSSAVADAVVLPDLYTRGEDVGFADFVLDLSFGAALGGLLGGVGGSVGNKRQAWIDAKVREALADAGQDTGMGTGVVQDAFPRNELADTMRMHASPETRQVVSRAMEKALLDFHDGRDVDVEDIFKGTDTLNQLEHHTVVGALESGEFADVDFGSLHQGHKEAPDVGVIDDPLAPGRAVPGKIAGEAAPTVVTAEAKGLETEAGSIQAEGVFFDNSLEHATWMKNKEAVAPKLDADGSVDIGGIKVPFGVKTADGQWMTTNNLFKHISVADLETAVVRGRVDADALHSSYFTINAQGKITAVRSASPTGSLADMQVAVQARFNGEPFSKGADGTLALGELSERFTAFNQRVDPVSERGTGPVFCSDKLEAASRKLHGEQKAYPNTTWDNLHAEMHILQRGAKDGLLKKGGSLEIVVTGKRAVCEDCQVGLPIVAEDIGLLFMTVVDKFDGVVYYWRQGMTELEPLGNFSSAQPGK